MDWLISTRGFTTPMRGVKLMRLAGCCSRALVQAARTRSFAILCDFVMNACRDRCVWYVDCSSDRVLSVAVQCYVVTSLCARRAPVSKTGQSVGGGRSRRVDGWVAQGPLEPREAGLQCQLWIGKARTPSLRQEQQFCTAEVIAAIVSIDDRSRAN